MDEQENEKSEEFTDEMKRKVIDEVEAAMEEKPEMLTVGDLMRHMEEESNSDRCKTPAELKKHALEQLEGMREELVMFLGSVDDARILSNSAHELMGNHVQACNQILSRMKTGESEFSDAQEAELNLSKVVMQIGGITVQLWMAEQGIHLEG